VSKINQTFFEIKTWLGKKQFVKGVTNEDIYITLNKKDSNKFEVFIKYKGPIKAPIEKGEEIAKLQVMKGNELLKTVPLYAYEAVQKINFFKSVLTSFNYMIWGDV